MKKVAFIGAGSMAEATISGILRKGLYKGEQIYVTNKKNSERLKYLEEKYNIQSERDKEALIRHADLMILTVKPGDLWSALDSFKDYVQPDQLIISLIAGVSTDDIEKNVDLNVPVIRAMPNTSAMVGYSATTICGGTYAKRDHIEQSIHLFNTIGTTNVVEEWLMDTVTGISGSGPAYIYYVVEAMEKAAVANGLDLETARGLITQTVIGAGKMLESSSYSTKALREHVTSPKGTTEAAIQTLEKYHFQEALTAGIQSAIHRSKELGEN